MSIGQLSSGAAAYGAELSSLTGLSPSVVLTWLGAEEPWGYSDPSNNYLNIGPGNSYSTPQQGAAAAASLINTSSDYAGIAQAAKSGTPQDQIAAIESSPWDAAHYNGTLGTLYDQVTSALSSAGATLTGFNWIAPSGTAKSVNNGIDHAAKSALGGAAGEAKKAAGAAASAVGLSGSSLEHALLTIAFVGAGLGLIVLGITRIFPGVTRTVTSAVGKAAGAAAVA